MAKQSGFGKLASSLGDSADAAKAVGGAGYGMGKGVLNATTSLATGTTSAAAGVAGTAISGVAGLAKRFPALAAIAGTYAAVKGFQRWRANKAEKQALEEGAGVPDFAPPVPQIPRELTPEQQAIMEAIGQMQQPQSAPEAPQPSMVERVGAGSRGAGGEKSWVDTVSAQEAGQNQGQTR